jgi:hypothetical protein
MKRLVDCANSSMVCAGTMNGRAEACRGGPLFYTDEIEVTIVRLVSWVVTCQEDESYVSPG